MADDDPSDPFLWDENRVVQELCTTNKSWTAPSAKKLSDPVALEAKLRDRWVDGQTLLTYDEVFGFDSLWQALEVKKLPDRLSIEAAITQFRKRSAGYHEWKRAQQLADSQTSDGDNLGHPIKSGSHTCTDPDSKAYLGALGGTSVDHKPAGGALIEPSSVLPELALSSQGVLSPALSPAAEPAVRKPSEAPEILNVEQPTAEQPPSKRRKIAPVPISADIRPDQAFAAIPTEGDRFLKGPAETLPQIPTNGDTISRGTAEDLAQADDCSGFLGPGALFVNQLTKSGSIDSNDAAESDFGWTRKAIPPGRRLQVAGAMKRFLRTHRATVPTVNQEEDLDPAYPLFGESDDDESLDSETWLAMEEEEQERLAKAARMAQVRERLLSKDQVAEAVQRAIQDLEARWVAEKKPGYDRKAWRIWQEARHNPNRMDTIHKAKGLRDNADRQLTLFANEIIELSWSVENEVQQKAAGSLEMCVYERKYQNWLIGVLESPRQPPKPSALPKPATKSVKRVSTVEDEEVLTSDSDDMDDFIDYDDNDVALVDDHMDIDLDPQPAQPSTPGGPASGVEADTELPEAPPACSGDESNNDLPPIRSSPKKIKTEKAPPPATPRQAHISDREVIEIGSSPSSMEELDEVPGFDDLESIERIRQIGIEYWEKYKDAERLVAALLCDWSPRGIAKIAEALNTRDPREVWDEYIWPSIENPEVAERGSVELDLGRLFDVYISKTASRVGKPLRPTTLKRLKREEESFAPFCAHLQRIIRHLLPNAIIKTPPRIVVLEKPAGGSAHEEPEAGAGNDLEDSDSDSDESLESSSDAPVPSSKRRRRQARKQRDKEAEKLRLRNVKLNEERERRIRQLREKLAESGAVPGDKSRLIVNETKESDDQALIYINDHIGRKIKDHQIEGVRFMWNQVVVDSNVRQGCLLAHTMGLGKTMQVITLLVVIAEASASPDESVRSQIPESLRESKTLILCPASLVDNWLDEIMLWAPGNVLGPVRKIDQAVPARDRFSLIQEWASGGGVLAMGYTLFTSLVKTDEVAKLLLKTPNLVIGDEAHQLKNPESKRHQATTGFKTMNRIALTGSPLTNKVMDYYSMINWVAPNYLGPVAEFRQRYEIPIKEGLYADSDSTQKRRARKMLKVLNETVAPKVHRKDIQVLFQELPAKKEFIITLPLTERQVLLYETYIEWATTSAAGESMNVRAWSLAATLGLVLAHPFIFKTVAQKRKDMSKAANDSQSRVGEEDSIEGPENVVHDMLSKVSQRDIEDYAHSNKIIVLLRILDECRKVGDKVLIFSQRIPTLDYLENIFKRRRVVYQRLDSQTPVTARQSSVRKFNTDPNSQVYLISTRAGGVGLNMFGANRVVIFDFRYTPAEEQQAIGRAYRLGQTKPVYVYWLTNGGTFEDVIHNSAIFKTQLASRVVDKKNPDPWSKRSFAEYFVMPKIPDQEDLTQAFGQDRVLDALLQDDVIGKIIRKITSTETFEKEENYELSAEDQQEVEKLLELQRLRLENPEEYARRAHEIHWESRIDLGMAPPPLSFPQPSPADSKFQTITQPTDNRSGRIITIKVPEHMRDDRAPKLPPAVFDDSVSSTGLVQGTLPAVAHLNHTNLQKPVLTLNSDSARPSAPSLPSPHATTSTPIPTSTQTSTVPGSAGIGESTTPLTVTNRPDVISTQTAGLQPILAVGTHYKSPNDPLPSTAPIRSPPANEELMSTSAVSESKASLSASLPANQEFKELFDVHSKLCEEGQHTRYHPNDLVNKYKGVLIQNRIEPLPFLDKMQYLGRFSKKPRFAEAMLAGHIKPEQLASMTRSEMEVMSTSLDAMPETQFKQLVWTSKADLNVCADTHNTQLSSNLQQTDT
jgi:SNF2 family DNA or RNA helicase